MENSWGDEPESLPAQPAAKPARILRRLALPVMIVAVIALLPVLGWLASARLQRIRQLWALPYSTLPADFDHHDAFLVSFPAEENQAVQQEWGRLAEFLQGRGQLLVQVDDAAQESSARSTLAQSTTSTSAVRILRQGRRRRWAREVRLRTVARSRGGSEVLHTADELPLATTIGHELRLELRETKMPAQSHHVLSNGIGLCLATRRLLDESGEAGSGEFAEELAEYMGAKLVWLEPLENEPSGAVDKFALFTAADTIVVGRYAPSVDAENAQILDRNAAKLQGLATPSGPLRVVRIPMPSHTADDWPSFTEVALANRLLLYPAISTATDEQREEVAATYRKLLPGWRIESIPSDELRRAGGSLRRAYLPLRRTQHAAQSSRADFAGS